MAQGFWSSVTSSWLGSVGNDQGDGNDNRKKAIGLKKQNNFARVSSIFVHFFYLFLSWTTVQSFRIQLQKNLPTFDELNETEKER